MSLSSALSPQDGAHRGPPARLPGFVALTSSLIAFLVLPTVTDKEPLVSERLHSIQGAKFSLTHRTSLRNYYVRRVPIASASNS